MHKLYKIRTLLDFKGVKPKYNYVHIDEFFMAIFFLSVCSLLNQSAKKKNCKNYNRVTQKRILHFNILARGKEADEHATQLAYLIYFANVIVHFFEVLIFKCSNELYICSIEPCISIFINFLAIFFSVRPLYLNPYNRNISNNMK